MSQNFFILLLFLIVVTEIYAQKSPSQPFQKSCNFDNDYLADRCPMTAALETENGSEFCKNVKLALQCRKDLMNEQCADKKQVNRVYNVVHLEFQEKLEKCVL